MRVLRLLLIALVVVNFSNAQESSDRSVQEVGQGEIEAADISEPNASKLEKANNGDQKSLAALKALEEGNALWRSGEEEECLARRNRDCALSQYNRLQIMDHAFAKTLFTAMFRERVVDASRLKKP